MRSFAFSSIQDQRAELETERGRGGEKLSVLLLTWLSACLIYSLHTCYTVSEWGKYCSPKANRQTDTQTSLLSTSALWPPPLLPPATFGLGSFWFASVIPWVVCFFGLDLFLVSSYKKSVTPAPRTTVCPTFACPSAPFSLGVWSKGSVS